MNLRGTGPIMVASKLTRRAVKADDYDWLLDLRSRTIGPHLRAMGIVERTEGHREAVEKDFDHAEILLKNEQPVGMIKLVTNVSPWHLRQIQVEPKFQGQGIGKIALTEMLERAQTLHVDVVLNVLKLNPAQHLYLALGFTIVEENEQAFKMLWRVDHETNR